MVSELTFAVSQTRVVAVAEEWCAWLVWALSSTHHGTCTSTRPTDVANIKRSWIGVDRRGRQSSKGGCM
jgi:hypothetical protein